MYTHICIVYVTLYNTTTYHITLYYVTGRGMDEKVADLSQICRTGLSTGGTFMSSSGRPPTL